MKYSDILQIVQELFSEGKLDLPAWQALEALALQTAEVRADGSWIEALLNFRPGRGLGTAVA